MELEKPCSWSLLVLYRAKSKHEPDEPHVHVLMMVDADTASKYVLAALSCKG